MFGPNMCGELVGNYNVSQTKSHLNTYIVSTVKHAGSIVV